MEFLAALCELREEAMPFMTIGPTLMAFTVADRRVVGTHGFAAISPSGRIVAGAATPSGATLAEATDPKLAVAHTPTANPSTTVRFTIPALIE